MALTTSGSGPVSVGYARFQSAASSGSLFGVSIISLRQNGVLVAETAVSGSLPIRSGRVFADLQGSTNTGIAVANPNDQPASINFFFTDPIGSDTAGGTFTIPTNGQLARFISEPPFNAPAGFTGTFSFTSSVQVAATAFRALQNERSEFVMTPLPIVDFATSVSNGQSVIFPHFADGGGWISEIVLVNPSDSGMTGTVEFGGGTFSFAIAPRSFWRQQTRGSSATTRVGSVHVTSDAPTRTPSGVVLLSKRIGGVTATMLSVPAVPPGPVFRAYMESDRNFGIDSGLAIANAATTNATVTLELTSSAGVPLANTSFSLPASTQFSTLLSTLAGFGGLPAAFQGLLRVSTDLQAGVSVIGIRRRINERGEALFSSTAAIAESANGSDGFVFPQLVDGSGYFTQFALFTNATSRSASGTVVLASPTGTASMNISDISNPKVPSLQIAYPDVGFPGATMLVNLLGSDFLPGRARIAITGGGVSTGPVIEATSGSVKAAFAVDATASLGDRTVAVVSGGGTSNPVTLRIINVQTMSTPSDAAIGQANISLSVVALFESIHRYYLGGIRGVQFYVNGINDAGITTTNAAVQGNQITATMNVGANAIVGPHTIVLVTPSGNIPSLGTFMVHP